MRAVVIVDREKIASSNLGDRVICVSVSVKCDPNLRRACDSGVA